MKVTRAVRRIITTIIGSIQSTVGVLAAVFAFILYFDSPLLLFVLITFAFFSIISGLFLVSEGLELL